MLILQDISYVHPNGNPLFNNINLTVNTREKIAITGNNGAGKSTLLKIIAGVLSPSAGHLAVNKTPYYVPQVFGQFNNLTVAQCLGIEAKTAALQQILAGNATDEQFTVLNDDWNIEERCMAAFAEWELGEIGLSAKMNVLSGGQQTKVFLAGISIHNPDLILLDEPSNHLDSDARQQLYHLIQVTTSELVVVSHDRTLLSYLDTIGELTPEGIDLYGGNYDFYLQQKEMKIQAINDRIGDKEKAMRKARETERESLERQQRSDARGKKKQEKAGVAKIMMNTLRNKAENSAAKMKSVHAEKNGALAQALQALRSSLPEYDKMKFGFDDSELHKGKILFNLENVNAGYGNRLLWRPNLHFQILSGERIALKGRNGSGKTSLLRLLLGELEPAEGIVKKFINDLVYIDQSYSLINDTLTVYDQARLFNTAGMEEHEIKIRLTRFLFTKEDWDKTCGVLSGGERMRLSLCCISMAKEAPDLIILDEPTNNLDIQNVTILTNVINTYRGTVIAVSHDERFTAEINVNRVIQL